MTPITMITGKTVVLDASNIDTDRIIPARFLKGTSRDGLGRHLFADWRYDECGNPRPDFPLNSPTASEASILVAGDNFGCGSSREHAAWALFDFGFRAVVSTSFADIFRGNALKNRVLPVTVSPATHHALQVYPDMVVTIDVGAQTLSLPDGRSEQFPLDPFSRYCLTQGVDELGFLLAKLPEIEAFEKRYQ